MLPVSLCGRGEIGNAPDCEARALNSRVAVCFWHQGEPFPIFRKFWNRTR